MTNLAHLISQTIERLRPAVDGPDYPEFHRQICAFFCAQNTRAIGAAVSKRFPHSRVTVAFDPSAPFYVMSCLWSQSKATGSHFTFGPFEPGHLLGVVVDRWLSTFPLFLQVDRAKNWRDQR